MEAPKRNKSVGQLNREAQLGHLVFQGLSPGEPLQIGRRRPSGERCVKICGPGRGMKTGSILACDACLVHPFSSCFIFMFMFIVGFLMMS